MIVKSSQSVTIDFRVEDETGVLVDADSTPTATLYRNGVATGVSVTVASITGTGRYSASWSHSGYEHGDQLRLEATATVDGTEYSAVVWDGAVDNITTVGAGSVETVLTITVSGQPEDGVAVWVTTDVAGLNVVAGTVYTNALGKTPTLLLDPGTYYAWKQKAGANFTNPEQFTVAA